MTNDATSAGDRSRQTAWGQELRGVHQRLRDALDIARERIEAGADPDSMARDLRLYCVGFCATLTGHHTSEDGSLSPLVLTQRPDLSSTVAILKQDHGMIGHLIRDLEQAIRIGGNSDSLLQHLDGIEAVMETHFRFEEKQLVGVLDSLHAENLDKATLFGTLALP